MYLVTWMETMDDYLTGIRHSIEIDDWEVVTRFVKGLRTEDNITAIFCYKLQQLTIE